MKLELSSLLSRCVSDCHELERGDCLNLSSLTCQRSPTQAQCKAGGRAARPGAGGQASSPLYTTQISQIPCLGNSSSFPSSDNDRYAMTPRHITWRKLFVSGWPVSFARGPMLGNVLRMHCPGVRQHCSDETEHVKITIWEKCRGWHWHLTQPVPRG